MTIEQKIKEYKELIARTKKDIESGTLTNSEKWYAKGIIDHAKLEIQRLEL
jgi:anti-sigma28 factor (negative regulator of flagellin synthesis)